MTNHQPEPIFDEKADNPQLYTIGGIILFVMGVLAVLISGDDTEGRAMLVLGTVFLSAGFPLVLFARVLKMFKIVEKRLNDKAK